MSQIKISVSPANLKSSFLSSEQKRVPTNRNTSLSQQFIYEVLGLQQQFRKYKNKESLTKLIQHYRKLVEFYSQKNDKISVYFLQKISLLSAEVPNMQQSNERLTMSMANDMQLQQQPIEKRFASSKTNHLNTPVKYDPQMKRRQRSKNAQIAIEVSKIKKRANARTILNSYYEECLDNNILVANDLQNQRKNLQEKLLAIHQRSLDSVKQFSIISTTKQTLLFDQNGNTKGGHVQNDTGVKISQTMETKQSKSQSNQIIVDNSQKNKDQLSTQIKPQQIPMLNFSFNI